MGFRCFDLDALSEQEPHDQLSPPGMIGEAVAQWPQTR
jgi:hypothetical protein